MADVVGRISTLPNSYHEAREWCDNHPNVKAVVRIQGETDSFGAELHDLCKECHQAHLRYLKSEASRTGQCEWCSKTVKTLKNARDHEEGLAGRVYRVCAPCIAEQKESVRRDSEASDDSDWD